MSAKKVASTQLLAYLFAGDNMGRPQLENVHLDPNGTAHAADGHIMVRVPRDPSIGEVEGEQERENIPRGAARAMLRLLRGANGFHHVELASDGDKRTLSSLPANDLTVGYTQTEEGKSYPGTANIWEKCESSPVAFVEFDAALLVRALSALVKMGEADYTDPAYVRIDLSADPKAPVKLTLKTLRRTIEAVIMPVRPEAERIANYTKLTGSPEQPS